MRKKETRLIRDFLILVIFFLSFTGPISFLSGLFISIDQDFSPGSINVQVTGARKYQVEFIRDVWTDEDRKRPVPIKIYYPLDKKGPSPIILFSHGLGGSREGYEYLGRFWAENGLISVHLQHPGSDEAVWKGQKEPLKALKLAASNPANALERAKDVSFVIDQLIEANKNSLPLKGNLDIQKIGMAGHSFGAHTTLLIAGQLILFPLGREMSLADKRVKAAIPMSAPVPAIRRNLERIYSQIKIPCLHMTGTLDDSPIGETKAEERRIPFDYMSGPDLYLVIFIGGDHMIFSGRPRLGFVQEQEERDKLFQEKIKGLTLAFWQAYLEGNKGAERWLKKGGAKEFLANVATFEMK